MKTRSILHLNVFVSALSALSAAAAEPVEWRAKPGDAPAMFARHHGSTLEFRCEFKGYGGAFAPGAEVMLWYQTNGMGRAWWSVPAARSNDVLTATWPAAADPGADRVSFFFGAPSNAYASAVVRLMASPGFTPNVLSPPVRRLDFAAVEIANAPYYTKSETESKIAELAPAPGDYEAVSNKTAAIELEDELWRFHGVADNADHARWASGLSAHEGLHRLYFDDEEHRWISNEYYDLENHGLAYLDDLADVSNTANGLSGRVAALETWAVGDETALSVTDAGTSNATLRISYTNRVMYSSAAERTNTVNEANAYTDRKTADVVSAVDAALATKADRAWGTTTSGGAPSPEDTLYVEKRKVTITGGGNYAYLASSTGGYWVLSVSLGSEWTMQALADAQNPTNPATASFIDADGNAAWTVTSTGTRVAHALQDQQYLYVEDVGGNDVVTITYPITSDDHPTCLYDPECIAGEAMKEASAANFPDYIALVEWSGHSGEWVCRVTMNGKPGRGFFAAKYVKVGTVYTRYDKPLGFSTVVIGNDTYRVHVETMNGKKVMVLENL